MKKLIYLIAVVVCAATIGACSDDAGPDGNYGDKGMRPDINISGFYSKADPSQVYYLEVDPQEPIDTTYNFPSTTVPYRCYKPITVPAALDTFIMRINSNARWTAAASAEFKTGLSVISGNGNGDADLIFRCTANGRTQRTRTMYVYSNDSSVMHRIQVIQLPKE